MIAATAAAVCALVAGPACAATTYTGSSSQGESVWLKTSRGAVTGFKLLFSESCRNPRGRPTGSTSGRYTYRGDLHPDPRGRFSHRVHEHGLLTAQRNQRFDVAIAFSGTVYDRRASGSFEGVFRFFTLRGRYVGSCTTGSVTWSTQTS